MEMKYEFIGEGKIIHAFCKKHIVYRIRALKDFRDVKAGDLGGWIEYEGNLSHIGDCWVYDNAMVFGSATVSGDSRISDSAVISGNARVSENATIKHNAVVTDDAQVYGHASVQNNAKILIGAKVSNYAYIGGRAVIGGYTEVHGNAIIIGDSIVADHAQIAACTILNSNAFVGGDTRIFYGNAVIRKDASITCNNDIITVGPIGSRNDYTTFYRNKHGGISVSCGCFQNTIDKFEKAVEETHGDSYHGVRYKEAIKFAKSILGLEKEVV